MRRPPLPGTLSLPGPSTLTFQYLLDLVESIAINPPSRAPVLPKAVALALTKLSQSLWWPTLCPDEVERRYIDDVDVPGDWEAVGVTPSEIESHALTYLRRYRSAFVFCSISLASSPLIDINRENFVRPVVFPPRTVRETVFLSSVDLEFIYLTARCRVKQLCSKEGVLKRQRNCSVGRAVSASGLVLLCNLRSGPYKRNLLSSDLPQRRDS